jgi:hypothetical protein
MVALRELLLEVDDLQLQLLRGAALERVRIPTKATLVSEVKAWNRGET